MFGGNREGVTIDREVLDQCSERRTEDLESCRNRWHEHVTVFRIPPFIGVEIGQPSEKQRPVVAPHQFLADADELVDNAIALRLPPAAFNVPFPPIVRRPA